MMRVEVDLENCVACEICETFCPEVFYFSEDDFVLEILKPYVDNYLECVNRAIESCPVRVIKLIQEA